MSYRGGGRGFGGGGGRGRGGGRGGRGGSFRGGRGGGGRGGGGRGGYNNYNQGPPDYVVEIGNFAHPCQDELVCKGTNEKIPYFNAPIYLENKSQIGKVDEIFGHLMDYYFSVKLSGDMKANSFNKGEKFFIDPMKLLPLQRFLPAPKGGGRVQKRGGGRGGRGGRGGGRGGFRGGRGGGGGFRGGGGGFRGGGGGFRGGKGGGGFRGNGRGGGGGFRGGRY
ncbi:H/ACA ribonucleoprotein complex subunit 1-like [Anneissia japonica]|uniref:H/ACA ribonucleoprotein complex subunit 1-like n=1 Tax=Anneissia japonica TaxID=1529436 RepID=UPI001425A1E5|nr:H/ACA ribonucleoprotein complex subunit 1-like [Anneissia japonica]XP_033119049.1 H/ACA ribonucleoprotein complex subunit 1-like [Anneissia japonica]